MLKIVENDVWLQPVAPQMEQRFERFNRTLSHIEQTPQGSLYNWADAHLHYGFHYDPTRKGWWFREWLPGAKGVYLFGEFNDWQRTQILMKKESNGDWSVFLSDEKYKGRIASGGLVKMLVYGENGWLERIPAYIRRTVQNELSKDFSGQIWMPESNFDWGDDSAFNVGSLGSLLIYESHVGMAQEEPKVGSYWEFTETILPRVKALGYNTIQLMAIAEHPYYGSFGYHVSNFYAPSSRFGTPEELKTLVRTAHKAGIAVVMDLVHSHYVKNINEGLNALDGTDHLYSPPGERGYQPYWDSMNFDYNKPQVLRFLLSNIRYWMEEFHFDGFRFDGVTSMLYAHHGYTDFVDRNQYFDDSINLDAITYLTLANQLIHQIRPDAVTIAEDVSGMPGMCEPIADGGIGFDYRLGMSIPDYWIELLENYPDEQWDIWEIWNRLMNRLPQVKTIAYCESHDQAIVGDKTIAFRLIDKEMYYNMDKNSQSIVVDRGIALHKMIRLVTIALGGQAYLCFMGNEFGHPEWIDFPREDNGWSYEHARRQWSLAENDFLRYSQLLAFDKAMIALMKQYKVLESGYAYNLLMDQSNQTMVFEHSGLIFVFNWSPTGSIPNYELPVREAGKYQVIFDSDAVEFGGFGRLVLEEEYFTHSTETADGGTRNTMRIYNLNRTALVFKRV